MDVTILGPGRLGRSLAALLPGAGHAVRLVGRGEPVPPADVVLLTVPDDAIAAASAVVPAGPAVLHMSGATDLAPVRSHAVHGSLHPLMTFPGPEHGIPDLAGVPAAVDGNEAGVRVAERLAVDLGLRPVRVPGDRRLYHAAAVLAGNGATILLAEAARALEAAGVDRAEAVGLLLPLVMRSIANADPDPVAVLTGPVARGDAAVLAAHRRALVEAGLSDVADLHRALVDAGLRAITRVKESE